MPLYEYACKRCHNEFELLVRGAEKPACPHCGDERLEKLLSVPAAHTAGAHSLPVCGVSDPGMCGPQCGGGRCAFE